MKKPSITPVDLYRTSRISAWRIEVLQHYNVPSDHARQQAFHAGEPLPPPRVDKVYDLKLIADLRHRGVHVGRVHVVDRPLSDYVRYELAVYAENVAAGEDVRIADRSLHPELAVLTQDFVIADPDDPHPGVILFDYDSDGRVQSYHADCSRKAVAKYRKQFKLALSLSESLAEFTAASLNPGR